MMQLLSTGMGLNPAFILCASCIVSIHALAR